MQADDDVVLLYDMRQERTVNLVTADDVDGTMRLSTNGRSGEYKTCENCTELLTDNLLQDSHIMIDVLSGNHYIYFIDSTMYYFDSTTLKLTSVEYAGETITLTRDASSSRVTSMSHSGGSILELEYSSDGLIDAAYLTHDAVRTFL